MPITDLKLKLLEHQGWELLRQGGPDSLPLCNRPLRFHLCEIGLGGISVHPGVLD
jgi:hypothetical protein